ncbi:MAG: hypothetical protein ACREHD_01155, partial [Pirellulales bacterium]
MTEPQRLWWRQAQSDHQIFVRLRGAGASECHLLHYLQMATEKLSKAYLWRSGHAPPKSHTGLVRFLKSLLDRRTAELSWISRTLGFARPDDLEKWVHSVRILAYDLQNIAPAEAQHGPNAEYPWPHDSPVYCPADYKFPLWNQLANTGQGRKLTNFIERAIRDFDKYA